MARALELLLKRQVVSEKFYKETYIGFYEGLQYAIDILKEEKSS